MRRSKTYKKQLESFDKSQQFSLEEAIQALKKMDHVKFDETVEVAMKLGIDPRQSDQALRGAISLPNGTGKTVRVIVAAEGDAAAAARDAGADEVGMDDLIEKIKGGWLDFDYDCNSGCHEGSP